MKRFITILFVGLLICSLCAVPSSASTGTEVTVNLEDLDNITRNNVLNKLKELKKKKAGSITNKLANMDPAEVTKWTGAITKTIKDVCHDLNVEVNDFAKTPVGIGIVGIIIYKVVGADFISSMKTIFFTLLWWFIVSVAVIISFRHFHMCKKVKVKTPNDKGKLVTTDIKYVKRYNFNSNDGKVGSAWAHSIVFAVANVIAIALLV